MFLISVTYVMIFIQYENMMEIDQITSISVYYWQGMCLVVPYCFTYVLTYKWKQILPYLMGSIIFLGVMYYGSPNRLFYIITILLWTIRLMNRISGKNGMLQEVSYPMIGILVVYYIISLFYNREGLQQVILFHIFLVGILIHTYEAILRLERYIEIRRNRAYMPIDRIVHTGIGYILIFLGMVFLVMTPIIVTQYKSVQLTPLEIESTEEVLDFLGEQEQSPDATGSGMGELYQETEQNPILHAIWEITGRIAMYSTYVALLYWICKGMYRIVLRFQTLQIEENDVIESIYQQEDTVIPIEKAKNTWKELFSRSEEMRIRRQYKKQLKKYTPKSWQTPEEMEKMANLEIEELHNLYEKVRYGK